MLDLDQTTARRIIDAIAIAIDGKPSSAKTLQEGPFDELAHYSAWGPPKYESVNDTPRSAALVIALLVFSGGQVSLRGIEMNGVWFRAEKYVVNELITKGRAQLNAENTEISLTQAGWAWIAGVLEGLAK